uniref:RNA_pol_L_2 domain-containing protein n=1 Tax=Gongylonema pulchrum TaxID=637853 RepID=A0A183EF90_9BILA
LEDKILIRVQTKQGVVAADVLVKALEELEYIFASIGQKFEDSYKTYSQK